MLESIVTATVSRAHPPLPSRALGVAALRPSSGRPRAIAPGVRMEALNRIASVEERLPFTVRLVRSDADLRKAVQIRHAAYARHVPDLARTLQEPEATDTEPGVVVLLAESKVDGSPLGTARIQTNQFRPLCVEQSVTLPPWMDGERLAEVTRLGIVGGLIGRLVKTVLIKASFQFCEREGVSWAVAAGRAPIDKHYERLLFVDTFPEQGFVPLAHAGNLPHRVMAFEIDTGPMRWHAAEHPLLDFFCHTRHPDIDLGAPVAGGTPAPFAAVSGARQADAAHRARARRPAPTPSR